MTRVLLVEDERLIAELLQDEFRDCGLEVEAAHSGQAALQRLEAGPHRFSVVVTDINLGGGVTGFEVAARARALNSAVTIIYVTGLPSNIDAAEVGALVFPKPFDPTELVQQVRRLLESG